MRVGWDVLRMLCTVVGALVLYCLFMAILWALAVRGVRRVGAARAARRLAGTDGPTYDGPVEGADRRARSWEELPSWLYRDRPWAVAAVLLGAPPIRARTAEFVDFPSRRIDWSGLLAASANWPADQRLMVLTAYELAFDSSGEVERALSEPVRLTDVVRLLDDDEVDRLRIAMDVRRGTVGLGEALTRLTD